MTKGQVSFFFFFSQLRFSGVTGLLLRRFRGCFTFMSKVCLSFSHFVVLLPKNAKAVDVIRPVSHVCYSQNFSASSVDTVKVFLGKFPSHRKFA